MTEEKPLWRLSYLTPSGSRWSNFGHASNEAEAEAIAPPAKLPPGSKRVAVERVPDHLLKKNSE